MTRADPERKKGRFAGPDAEAKLPAPLCVIISRARRDMRPWARWARDRGYRVSVRSPDRIRDGAAPSILLIDCASAGVSAVDLGLEARRTAGGENRTILAVRVPPDEAYCRRLLEIGVDDFVGLDAGLSAMELAIGRAVRLSEARDAVGQARDALRLSEARFGLHAMATSDSIYDWDLLGDKIDWNDHHEEIKRFEQASAWWLDRVLPEDRGRVAAAFRRALRGRGDQWRQQYRFRRVDGGYSDMIDRGFLMRNGTGEAVRLIGAMTDISELKATVRALREVRDELEARVERRTGQLRNQIAERKRVEQELVRTGEAERRSIGQDLHDGLCQRLAGILCMAQTLHARMARRRAEDAPKLGEIAVELDRAIAEAREISWGLSPVGLGAHDLYPALEHMLANTESVFGVNCRLVCDPSMTLPGGDFVLQLYRIAQEAVSNAVRHGRAETVEVVVRGGGGKIQLEVKNDGVPFPETPPAGGGMGLRIMAYRAASVGGELSISPGRRGGTHVVCTVPLSLSPEGAPAPGAGRTA